MTTWRAVSGALFLAAAGCASAPPPVADPEPTPPAPATAGAPTAPDDAALAPRTSSEPASAGQCRLSFSDTTGCDPTEVEKLVAPVRQRIEECRGDKGGRIRVRLRGDDGKLRFTVEPGASLDPRERQCILDALSTIPSDDLPGDGRGVPSTGFTSMLTIEW